MIKAFDVVIPSNGDVVTVEDESQEGQTDGSDVFSSEGGAVILQNSGTVNLLLGGNNENCVYPFNAGDTVTPPSLGANDKFTAKIASGAAAGQVSVIQITK